MKSSDLSENGFKGIGTEDPLTGHSAFDKSQMFPGIPEVSVFPFTGLEGFFITSLDEVSLSCLFVERGK